MRFPILFLALTALPAPVLAQEGPGSSSSKRVGGTAVMVVKGSEVAGQYRAHVGGWVGLVFGERLTVGGGGLAMLENVELAAAQSESGFDLGMGYGGLQVRYWWPLRGGFTLDGGALLGAGHAEVTDLVQGLEAGSDNFFVVEPEISVLFGLFSGVHVGAAAGYRVVWGAEDLPRVATEDLRGPTAALTLKIGGW